MSAIEDQPDVLADPERVKTIAAIAETARRARGEAPALPHPFETDAILAERLQRATELARGRTGSGWAARLERLVAARLLPGQLAFNEQLLHALHQLDHRDRQQREEIADLQQQLAALRAANAVDR